VGGQHDFSALAFTVHNSTFKYGDFVNNLVSFVIMAAVVYYFVVLPVGKMLERFKPTPDAPVSTQECRHCLSKIPVKATVCAFCTRELATGEPTAAT
jgi:large conductance mechanosensitive channel